MSDYGPSIPHVAERKRLAELAKTIEAINAEERETLAPLVAEHECVRVRAAQKFPRVAQIIAWGITSMQDKSFRRDRQLYDAFLAPSKMAVNEALAAFEERTDAAHEEIETIEGTIGAQLVDDADEYVVCAITGLPVLETDEHCVVLRAALPQRETEGV